MNYMSEWIPLMDYAVKKGVSLSTLRRHIKSNKVEYRVENGRYLLLDEGGNGSASHSMHAPSRNGAATQSVQSKLQKLERDLQRAQEEIAELKMLIALYEERMSPTREN